MKREIFGTFALWAWVPFFLKLGKNWPGLWGFIFGILGVCALFCTLELVIVERESKKWLYGKGSPWTLASMLIWIVFGGITSEWSLYWSLLAPLLAIVIAYGIAWLWPDPKREEQPGDMPVSTEQK